MTSNELFRGLLAAVSAQKSDLPGNHSAIHRAFFQVLKEVRKPEVQEQLDLEDFIDIDYDPLYGQSAWFDKALTRAQRDHIVSFPNPSYDKISIKFGPEARSAVLEGLRSRNTIERLANIFVGELEGGQTRTSG